MKITQETIIFLLGALVSHLAHANPVATEKTTRIGQLEWDIHEVTIGTVKKYADATGFVSSGEKEGGSFIYEAGWTRKANWTWRTPFGVPAKDQEPAVHLNFYEAKAICAFFGKRLPTDSEWTTAAFTEQRTTPTQPFIKGKKYTYANGDPQAFALLEWLCRFKGGRSSRLTLERHRPCARDDNRTRRQWSLRYGR